MSYRTSKMKRMQETMEKIQEIDRNSLLTLQERHQRGLITLKSCLSDFLYCFCCFQAAGNFLNARTSFLLPFNASKLKNIKCLMQDKCIDECLSVLDECLSVKPQLETLKTYALATVILPPGSPQNKFKTRIYRQIKLKTLD